LIKLKIKDLDKVINQHFNGINDFSLARILFLKLIFEQGNIEKFDLNIHTKKSLLNQVLTNKTPANKDIDFNNIFVTNLIEPAFANYKTEIIKFFDYLLDKDNLKNIINAEPQDLEKVESAALNNLINLNNYPWNELIYKIFDYDSFSHIKSEKKYNLSNLADNLKVSVCPYCNRQYTSTIFKETKGKGKKKKKIVIRPTFDHFYDKKTHPLLALSFYNLIPSCYFCNSMVKHSKVFDFKTHIHPYAEDFGQSGKFNYFIENFGDPNNSKKRFKIIFEKDQNCKKYDRISKSIEDCELEAIYQSHADIVSEMYDKVLEESNYHIDKMIQHYKDKGLFEVTREEIYRFYFSNYYEPDKFGSRILSKLTRDIFEQFLDQKLIKKWE
jgi:hypothetical protein